MERIISEEEKIKRAEEISARRQNRISAESINVKRKVSKLSKLFIQVIVCICIFGIMYFLSQKNSFAIEKIKPIMATDTDFVKVYNDLNEIMMSIIKEDEKIENKENNDNEKNNSEQSGQEITKQENNQNEITNEENNENKEENDNQNVESENNNEQIENEEQNSTEKQESVAEENQSNGAGGGNDGTQESETNDDVTYIKSKASFIKPVSGTITSPYGARTPTDIISANHAGVDIGAWSGTEIVASMEGTVELVSSVGDYGNHLKITNGDISTLYAHCSTIVVKEGDYISQGQKIAEVGSTGRATGPHLHFEIRRNNVTVDPQKILEL